MFSNSCNCDEFLLTEKIPRQARPAEQIKHHHILIAPGKCTDVPIFLSTFPLQAVVICKIRAGRTTTACCNRFRFGRTPVCIMPISLHRVKIIGSFRFLGKRIAASNRASSRIIHLSCYMFTLHFSLGYYVGVTHVRGHISGPSSPSQLRAMVGGIPLKSIFYFVFFNYKSLNGVLLANMRGIHRQPAHRSKGNHRCSQRGTMTRTEWPQLFR